MITCKANLKWIFFDLGSTITDESPFENYMLNYVYKFLENAGISMDAKLFNERLRKVIEERLFGNEGYKGIVREMVCHFTNKKQVFQKILCEYDKYVAPMYVEMQQIYSEAITVLEELREKWELGLIANQPKTTKNYLQETGLTKYFKVIVLSEDVGYSKPNPKIFLHALATANCQPEKALMVGDRLDNDIAPAKAIGMKTVRIKRGLMAIQKPLSNMEIADYEIYNLAELPSLLFKHTC